VEEATHITWRLPFVGALRRAFEHFGGAAAAETGNLKAPVLTDALDRERGPRAPRAPTGRRLARKTLQL
jgi:hypothetical protein